MPFENVVHVCLTILINDLFWKHVFFKYLVKLFQSNYVGGLYLFTPL